MTAPVRFLLVVAQFLCPLLFFTDLTRNPYFTQITLLNVALIGASALWLAAQAFGREGPPALRLPRTVLDAPLAAWAAVCVLTWTLAYFGHVPFFRPSMRSEGLRIFLFTLANTLLPFYLSARVARDWPAEPDVPVYRWAAFALIWGAGWALFPGLRAPATPSLTVWPHLWDGYGALLWAAGLAVAFRLTRRGGAHDFFHLALAAAFIASVYAIFQYFNVEWIWPKVLNPYGGRSVSTFGNPNFMSSYMVMLLPVAFAYYLQARAQGHRIVYAVVLLAMEAALLSSLTRSSWGGAVAALAVFALAPGMRARLREGLQTHGLLVTAAAALAVLWPESTIGGYAPSVVGRLSELSQAFHPEPTGGYAPLYQRVLIWSCAWLMGHENPLLGKGWGHFELFYPFYQGHVLGQFDFFRAMRTHANNAHNEILELFAQTGIAGVGVNLWLYAVLFTCAWRWYRRPAEPGGLWRWAAIAGAAGMLADNMLNVSLHFAVPAFAFWWLVGAATQRAVSAEPPWRELPLPLHAGRAAGALGLLLAVLGASFWWRQWSREAHYFLGFKLMRGGRLAAAVEQLEAAHRAHPREVNANYELGNGYARLEKFERAVWAYDEALSANAGYDEIYFNKATLLSQRLGRTAEALDHFRSANAINPTSYEIYSAMSQTLIRDPDAHLDEAIRVLEQAVRFFPADSAFLTNLGAVYNRKGERRKAIEAWSKALRLNPEMPQAEQNLLAVSQGGAAPEVLGHLRRFRELESRIAAKDFSAATLEAGRQVVSWFPRSGKAKYYLGNLELMHGQADRAVELLGPLAKAEPRHAGLQLNLGQAYARLGRRQDAAEAFRRVLSVEPNNEQAKQLLQALGQ
ncbi:MAG: tetratricopeptide repeat protein [Elusimicrobia bacterium]|nr:tetratricopeptide repeat protein [Elusimicrobiota bacterium]